MASQARSNRTDPHRHCLVLRWPTLMNRFNLHRRHKNEDTLPDSHTIKEMSEPKPQRSIASRPKMSAALAAMKAILESSAPQPIPTPPMLITTVSPFFALPRELRDMIYEFVFGGNGMDYVREQLRGFTSGSPSNFSYHFRALLTCQQFYHEALEIAYKSTCFYYFRSYSYATLSSHLSRLRPLQVTHMRHIAFWSNPYLSEKFIDDIPETIQLTTITICSNYMSGPIPTQTLFERMKWIVDHVKKVKSLKRFQFLTGCGIPPGSKTSDCEYALKLREVFTSPCSEFEGVSVGTFNSATKTTTLTLLSAEEKRSRTVELVVASVYEIEI